MLGLMISEAEERRGAEEAGRSRLPEVEEEEALADAEEALDEDEDEKQNCCECVM